MRPLTHDDLLTLDDFAGQRRELLAAHGRYLDRYRRVRIGPRVTLVFENRQTLWFRVQDVLRIARLAERDRVQQELEVYNRLLPGPGRLHAALILSIAEEQRTSAELEVWQSLGGNQLRFSIGAAMSRPADLLTCRPEDRCIGAAYWVRFAVDDAARRVLGERRQPAWFEIVHPSYKHKSAPVSDEVRQSLLEDLQMSDRDR
jgi:hypothetical protein